MSIDQLASAEPLSSERVGDLQTWKNYPWLHRAFREIGPGARAASDSWRSRIEDELKTTLDFKLRADGTAVVWCGMSGHDFRHDPSPKELLEGLAEAYRRELERVRTGSTGAGTWRMSAAPARRPTQALGPQVPAPIASPAPAEDSLPRALGAVLLPRAAQLTVIFVAVTALTLVLSAVANAVR